MLQSLQHMHLNSEVLIAVREGDYMYPSLYPVQAPLLLDEPLVAFNPIQTIASPTK